VRPRPWHRWLLLGPHRPTGERIVLAADLPVLHACVCSWLGLRLGDLASLDADARADELVWLPGRVYLDAAGMLDR
jgi:hypothetical protein